MSSELILYIEMDVLCAMYMIVMAINIIKSKASSREDKAFLSVTISVGVLLLTDIGAAAFNGVPGRLVRTFLYVDNTIYFVFTALGAYACLLYVDYILTENSKLVDDRRIMYVVPCTAVIVLSLASVRYGFIFTIDENNFYSRGSLHVVQQIIIAMYFIMSEIYAIYCVVRAKNYTRRTLCAKVFEFTTVPLLGLLLQIELPKAAIMWPMASIALFIMFSYSQNSLISMDSLTGLNNRLRLIKYLAEACDKNNGEKKLACIVFDIDGFKNINDRYGHAIGDDVICQVAGLLKKSVVGLPGSYFLARFTGTSFTVVCSGNENYSEKLISNFNTNLEAVNDSDRNHFPISVSYGEAEFVKFEMSSDDLLKEADNAMYRAKAAYLASRQKKSVEDVVK